MTYLSQLSTGIADTAKLSLSMWFRLPSSGGVSFGSRQSLLNWGVNGADDLLKVSGLSLYYASAGDLLYKYPDLFDGPNNFLTQDHKWYIIFTGWGAGPNPNPLPPPAYFGMANKWVSAGLSTVGLQSFDEWHHLALGYDGSGLVTGDGFHALSSAPVFSVALNRTDIGSAGAALASSPQFAFFDVSRGSNGMYVEGFPVGLPATQEQLDFPLEFTFQMQLAYIQVWFDQYIDWTDPANLDKVTTIKGSTIVPPTDPLTAQRFFGASDVYFYRDKSKGIQFQTNRGTAGPFTVVGTPPSDYFPGPGQSATRSFQRRAPLVNRLW